MACPQCGNPNLDVDAQNSVVFCKKCGFAVQVDPQTGNVTPLSQGSMPATGQQMAPPEYAPQGEGNLFGMDKLTFFMAGLALILFAVFILNLDLLWAGVGGVGLLYLYFRQ
ncbi:MAG TPA: TFIIB-type zinc ribbon-containing protein [Candidatus Norongarragalinales archaeon]|nr:TFIIB-type zinc ribbon-containing protein [Candidatus Norongarragalinales archaeon]